MRRLGRHARLRRRLPAPQVRSTSTGTWAAVSTVTTTLPAGWQDGDYALLLIHSGRDSQLTNVKGSEWERILVFDDGSTDGVATIYGRRLVTGDSAPTVALSSVSAGGTWGIAAFTGVDPYRPWEARKAANVTAAATVTVPATTLGSSRLLVSAVCHDPVSSGGTATPPPGFTDGFTQTQAADSLIALATKVEQTATTVSCTWSTTDTDDKAAAVVALVPIGGAADVTMKTDHAVGATAADVKLLWGSIDAADDARVSHFATGGPTNGAYRRVSLLDTDEVTGNRAEIGRNHYRMGESGDTTAAIAPVWINAHTFALYQQGQRRITRYWTRLATNFPTSEPHWNVVMQMKQTQPYTTGSGSVGGSPQIALEAENNAWRISWDGGLAYYGSVALVANVWVQHEFDIVYHSDPAIGRVIWRMNTGAGLTERYSGFLATLKTETVDSTYLAVGQSIPSHLRMGIYRNGAYIGDTHVDIADVEVVAPARA